MNDDDKIRELFDGFNPDMPSDLMFMDTLKEKMDSVELVRSRSTELRRRNRMAVVIAAMAGFAAGALFSLALPAIRSLLNGLLPSVTVLGQTDGATAGYSTLGWLIVGMISVIVAVNVYELALSLSKHKV